jgi:hypothetical protein
MKKLLMITAALLPGHPDARRPCLGCALFNNGEKP